MRKNLKSKVVKPPAKSGRKKESTNVDSKNESLQSEEDLTGKVPMRKNNFVYQNLSMATGNANLNSISRRVKQTFDYSKLNKDSIMESRTNLRQKAKNVNEQSGKGISNQRSRESTKGATKTCDHKTNKASIGAAINQIDQSNSVAGDGIMVTVHALDGEFEEIEESISEPLDDEEAGQPDNALRDNHHGQDIRQVIANEALITKQNKESQQLLVEHENEQQLLEKYENNPYFQNMVQRMVEKTISSGASLTGQDEAATQNKRTQQNEDNTGRKRQRTETVTRGMNLNQSDHDNEQVDPNLTPKRTTSNQDKLLEVNKLKLPTDTTIYAPGLSKVQRNDQMIDKISNFVEMVRLEIAQQDDMQSPMMRREMPQPGLSMEIPPQATEARERADRLILDAEHFKASITAPRGKETLGNEFIDQNVNQSDDMRRVAGPTVFPTTQCLPTVDNDDDFFHLTCHIDPTLRSKIERGDFMDLEKLLPKTRFPHRIGEDNRMEMVNREGMTYFVPISDHDNSINGIKRWDQAFRIYAAIYCKQNPTCPAEIWQYIYTIHTVASSFQWDNIAWYDYTFRQLMAVKPYCSWAKTYTQFWNLAMRNPLNTGSSSYSQSNNNNNQKLSGGKHKKYGDWRDNCCWIFNKLGRCTRASCRFENRCSYCGGYNHAMCNCHKAKRNSPRKTADNNGSSSNGSSNSNNNNSNSKK